VPISNSSYQARSLNWQRRAKLVSQDEVGNRGDLLAGDLIAQRNPCGSGLARDGGVSGDIDAGCDGLFAGKPAPTGSKTVSYFCGLSSNRKNRSRTCT